MSENLKNKMFRKKTMSKRIEYFPSTRAVSRRRIAYHEQHDRTLPLAIVSREMRNMANEKASEYLKLSDAYYTNTQKLSRLFMTGDLNDTAVVDSLMSAQRKENELRDQLQNAQHQWQHYVKSYADIRRVSRMNQFPGEFQVRQLTLPRFSQVFFAPMDHQHENDIQN